MSGRRPRGRAGVAAPRPTSEEREERRARRLAAVPAVAFADDLPITAHLDELRAAIEAHQVVVVAGETGSGKSTQLPKLCVAMGRGVDGMIGHTQPRRLAARAVAERVASELGTPVGGAVGYAVRFADRVGDDTLVKVMTDGILLAEIRHDRLLRAYDTIIVDEAHERSLNIDFLLGYLARLLPRRPDLKVIITSATIDTERMAAHFGAPVVQVEGRSYPVELRYRPIGEEAGDDRDQPQAIVEAVEELWAEGPGDVLVFLAGEREIKDAADALRRIERPDLEVLPLYARLAAAEQHRIFQPSRGRRVVLSTNVAETSLTVPGVRYVVDTGTARISRFHRRLKVQRLPIEPVSQASANQRAGRCGRTAPGICVRLYAEEDLDRRSEYTEPEILRTNLASVVLQMAALGLGDVATFPFVDPPEGRAVRDAVTLLEELGAFEAGDGDLGRRLTPLGRRLARLPLDPRLGRMVLEAERQACVQEVVVITAALSIQDPRERPTGEEAAADELHRRFADESSDFLSFVKLWDHLREQQRELSANQFRKRCRAEHLHHQRIREWQDIVSQLREVLADLGIHRNTAPADPDAIHRALLAGLLSHLGMRDGERREYLGARGARFAIAPRSVLARRAPKWIVAGELVETTRLWGRVVARVQPEWAEQLGAHLVQRHYSEPHWDPGRGAAVATERVTLYGLPIVTGRRVDYARIDPVEARRLFVQHALVEGDWTTHHRFVEENARTMEEVRALGAKVRRAEVLVDDDALHDLFDARVPAGITSARHFDRWWRDERQRRPDLMSLPFDSLVDPALGPIDLRAYPDSASVGDVVLQLSYVYDPGAPDDGVTFHVPLTLLHRIRSAGLDWHLPGYRRELLGALFRLLPRPVRRHLVPVADRVEELLATTGPADGPVAEVVARFAGRLAGERLSAADLDLARLPEHLRFGFSVEDASGRRLAYGRDLDELRRRWTPAIREAVARATGIERRGLTSWPDGSFPRVVRLPQGPNDVLAFPALVDEGESVAVRVYLDPAEQDRAMATGTRRLLLLGLPSVRKGVERLLSNERRLALARASRLTPGEIVADASSAAVDALVVRFGGPVWDGAAFDRLAQEVARHHLTETLGLVERAADVVALAAGLEARLDRLRSPGLEPAVDDLRAQLARLAGPGFVSRAGMARLPHVVRYLRAADRRISVLESDPSRDRERFATVRRLDEELAVAAARLPPGADGQADDVRWLLEELRVSLFAQSLGTAEPVSEPRVRAAISRLGAGARGSSVSAAT